MTHAKVAKNQNRTVTLNSKLLVLLSALCAVVTMHYAATNLSFSPDSTNYVVAARNLLSQGRLVVFANWPSESMEPALEPYTEYTPGFPVYLVTFLAVLHDPIVASAAAQVVAIGLLFVSIAGLVRTIQLNVIPTVVLITALTTMTCFRQIYQYVWTETLFIALSMGVLTYCLKLLNGDTNRRWYAVGVLLALSSTIKFAGVFNLALVVVPLLIIRAKKRRLIIGLGISCASVLPVVMWMLRNRIFYGDTTLSHNLGPMFRTSNIVQPYWYLRSLLGASHVLKDVAPFRAALCLCITLTVAVIGLYPLWSRISRFRLARQKSGAEPGSHSGYYVAAVGAVGHFGGIYAVSLLCNINELGHRLMSPTIALATVAWCLALRDLLGNMKFRWQRGAVVAGLLAVFLISPTFAKDLQVSAGLLHATARREQKVWIQLAEMVTESRASHFYTDRNFLHQLFANIPQRIIWDEEGFDKDVVTDLLSKGSNPFFLFRENGDLDQKMQVMYRELELQRSEFFDEGYVLYQ